MRLYKAQTVEAPEWPDGYEPEGWVTFCQEKWGEWRPFYLPSDERVYRSRSAAQRRVDLINSYGARAIIVEAEPGWIPVEVANRRRRDARVERKIRRHLAEVDRLRERTGGAA